MAPLLWENSLGENVPGFPKTRALWYPLRTLSETSVPHLVVFLKYFDTILLVGNRSRLGCILLHSPGKGNGEGHAHRFQTLCEIRDCARAWRNLQGGKGEGAVVVVGGVTPKRRLSIFQNCWHVSEKNIFGSKMLEKCICQVPVARGGFLSGKLFPKGMPKARGAIIIYR